MRIVTPYSKQVYYEKVHMVVYTKHLLTYRINDLAGSLR